MSELTTHAEVDAHFKQLLQESESMFETNAIFKDWRYAKEDIDRLGYWPPRKARIVNLTMSGITI